MKTISKILGLSLAAGVLFTSCSDDDDKPEVINEEETITTVIIKLTDPDTGVEVEFKSFDDDADDGPNAPVLTTGNLLQFTKYEAEVTLLNELDPDDIEDVTIEVAEEEDDEHQFFYSATGQMSISNLNNDRDGNPLGSSFELMTGGAGDHTFTIKLVHEPTKPNDGTIEGAGGEVEIDITFDVTVDLTAPAPEL